MKSTQDACRHAESNGLSDVRTAIEAGLKEKAKEFRAQGDPLYQQACCRDPLRAAPPAPRGSQQETNSPNGQSDAESNRLK